MFSTSPARRTCRGEICHAHPSDGSMHLTLHLADAKMVLDAGWGERHPIARGGWFERFVPGGFMMVYAPRDESEVDMVLRMVKAAAWFVEGCEGSKEEAGDGMVKPRADAGRVKQKVGLGRVENGANVRRDSGFSVPACK